MLLPFRIVQSVRENKMYSSDYFPDSIENFGISTKSSAIIGFSSDPVKISTSTLPFERHVNRTGKNTFSHCLLPMNHYQRLYHKAPADNRSTHNFPHLSRARNFGGTDTIGLHDEYEIAKTLPCPRSRESRRTISAPFLLITAIANLLFLPFFLFFIFFTLVFPV